MPAPDEDAVARLAAVTGWVRAVVLLVLLAYLTSSLVLPWKIASVAFGWAGVLCGVVASVKVLRRKLPGVLRVTVPLATLACLLFTVSTSTQVLFYQPTSDYEQCMATTVTDRSQAQCKHDYEQKLSTLQGVIGT
ncbi:hypothetical protein [Arthrobacter sp.]|uniref:hypothetical protein n=1 Tax=Arthrobacter sp. TaxID=1667 RepID=UPI003A8E5ED3